MYDRMHDAWADMKTMIYDMISRGRLRKFGMCMYTLGWNMRCGYLLMNGSLLPPHINFGCRGAVVICNWISCEICSCGCGLVLFICVHEDRKG